MCGASDQWTDGRDEATVELALELEDSSEELELKETDSIGAHSVVGKEMGA